MLETRESPHGTRRRRQCRRCGHRFTTFETIVIGVISQPMPAPEAPDPSEIAQELAAEIDADQIASDVSDSIEARVDERLDALAADIVDVLRAEAESQGGLSNGHLPELVAGDDYDEDEP